MQYELPERDVIFGPVNCNWCVILLLSILLHVQFGVGLPQSLKGQQSITSVPANCFDTPVGVKLLGTNGATIENISNK